MQSLFEEFFNKVSKFTSSVKWMPMRLVIRLVFYGVIIFFIVWLFYAKKYFIIWIALGLIILAEIAHYLRKWREKAMTDKSAGSSETKKFSKKPLNKNLLRK